MFGKERLSKLNAPPVHFRNCSEIEHDALPKPPGCTPPARGSFSKIRICGAQTRVTSLASGQFSCVNAYRFGNFVRFCDTACTHHAQTQGRWAATARSFASRSEAGDGEGTVETKLFRFDVRSTVLGDTPSRWATRDTANSEDFRIGTLGSRPAPQAGCAGQRSPQPMRQSSGKRARSVGTSVGTVSHARRQSG